MQDLSGKTVVVTGTLKAMTRAEAKKRLSAAGAKVAGSVSGSTDLVFFGEDAGTKLEAARGYGVTSLDERAMLAILGTPLTPPTLEGPLSDYLARFEAMVAELEASPQVHLVNAYAGMPMEEAEIEALERQWGGRLGPALRNLYRQADGLTLLWISEDNPNYNRYKHRRRFGRVSWSDFYDDQGACDGALCLLPLRDVLLRSWYDHHVFDWMNDETRETFGGEDWGQLELAKALRIFDYFNFFNAAAMVMRPGEPEGPVVLGDDHCACWTDSRRVSFEAYMEGQLASYARVQTRRSVMITLFGHREPVGRAWPAEPLPAAPPTGSARRVWVATREGTFRREGDAWVRVGDGLAELLDEKGRKQDLADLDFDAEGRPVVCNRRAAWRLSLDGGAERLFGGPQNAWGRVVVIGPDGAIALALSDRVLLQRPGEALVTYTKKHLGQSSPMAMGFLPDGSLVVGLYAALFTATPDGQTSIRSVDVEGEEHSSPMQELWVGSDGTLRALHRKRLIRQDGEGWTATPVPGHPYYTDLIEVSDVGHVLVSSGLQGPIYVQAAPDAPLERWVVAEPLEEAIPCRAAPDGQGGAIISLQDGSLVRANAEGLTHLTWAGEPLAGTEPRIGSMPYARMRLGPDGRVWLLQGECLTAVELG